jgi:hypothetical protein
VAEHDDIKDFLLRVNLFEPYMPATLHAILDYCCDSRRQLPTATQSQIVTGFRLPADILAKGLEAPVGFDDPLLRPLSQIEGSLKRSEASRPGAINFHAAFIGAESLEAGGLVVSEALRLKISRLLGLPVENITLNSTLSEFGVDSLVGLELKNWLARESGATVAVFEILGGATLRDIGRVAAAKSSMRPLNWGDA